MSALTWDLAQRAPSSASTAVDEAVTIRRVQAGDVAAFNALVVRHQVVAYNLACRLLGDEEQAADATQEAFLSAFRAIGRVKEGAFRAWLLRIVVNTCYDILRAGRRRPVTSLDAILDSPECPGAFEDPSSSVEDLVMRRELLARVSRGLQTLPLEQRVVVTLADVQGFHYDEIARITGAELGTVKSRLHRGRTRLREFLRAVI